MKSIFLILTFIVTINSTIAATRDNTLKSDPVQVDKWNSFVSELYELHLYQTRKFPFTTSEIIGGYGGGFANKKFYREISYINKKTHKLISKIQWEIKQPNTIHSIEVFLYNNQGQVKTDFYARYLPYARNAPVQTLINLHNYNDRLHAFRQFDANGELIYETCRGYFFNQKINLHLDDEGIQDFRLNNSDEFLNEAYSACFLNVSQSATHYLHPSDFGKNKTSDTSQPVELDIEILSQKIIIQLENPLLYIERGKLFFEMHEFDKAINDFNSALSIDNSIHQIYFERGMALARNGQIEEGISDLTHFIKYNPNSSLAFTKRGVRYIWAKKLDLAKKDLLHAVKLNNSNSEAHDDLGVIFAQEKNFDTALKHFSLAIQHDPSYQKAYHNLAMAYILTNKPEQALTAINQSLLLDNDSRNSLLLKSEILKALGKKKEADAVTRKAEFLPEGNWSERFNIQ